MPLTEAQKKLVDKQIEHHRHGKYSVDVELTQGVILEGLLVFPDVLRPESVSARFLAQFLYSNKDIYRDKRVLDMGCGTGIQGIVTALYGASETILSDISLEAVENTRENISHFSLSGKTQVIHCDLFERITGTFDVIIFNHPFFSEKPYEDAPVTIAMLDEGGLLERFLKEAPHHLNKDGIIIMPYFLFAGDTNNPELKGKKHGYIVKKVDQKQINTELHKGDACIFELTK